MTETEIERLDSYVCNYLSLHYNHHLKDIIDGYSKAKGIEQEFNIQAIGAGISRRVFKRKYSNRVYKIGNPSCNKSEWAFWNAAKPYNISKLLAKCYKISKNGYVLQQEYVPNKLEIQSFDHFTLGDRLNELFRFLELELKNKVAFCPDFHEDNINITSKSDLKIVDYGSMLEGFFNKNKDSVGKNLIRQLQNIFRKHDEEISCYINEEGNAVLNGQEVCL